MKYIVDDERIFNDIDEVISYCIDDDYHADDDYFVEWVNDSYSSVTIAGRNFDPYEILEGCAEYLLDDLRSQYCEERNEDDTDEARRALSRAHDGDEIFIQSYVVRVENEENEEEDETETITTIETLREKLELEENKIDEEEEATKRGVLGILQVVGG